MTSSWRDICYLQANDNLPDTYLLRALPSEKVSGTTSITSAQAISSNTASSMHQTHTHSPSTERWIDTHNVRLNLRHLRCIIKESLPSDWMLVVAVQMNAVIKCSKESECTVHQLHHCEINQSIGAAHSQLQSSSSSLWLRDSSDSLTERRLMDSIYITEPITRAPPLHLNISRSCVEIVCFLSHSVVEHFSSSLSDHSWRKQASKFIFYST